MSIGPDEVSLIGRWEMKNDRCVADSICDRISCLVEDYLDEIAVDESGWDTLYRDPSDGRYWELIYPQSHLHGGGPPTLQNLSERQACDKYHLNLDS